MSPAPLVVDVPASLAGMRADRAVALLTGVSRAVAADLVERGRVRVDGRPLRSRATPLEEGEQLEIETPEPRPELPPPDASIPLKVVHADREIIVVDKPPGLVVHPGAGHWDGTMVSALLARFADLADLAGIGDPGRPGIVHRLDRGTSGLLVVARTATAYHSLVRQFAERTVGRRYVALVAGHVRDDRGVVDAPIGRSTRSPERMAVAAIGRPARTGYEVLERLEEPLAATLLALSLETGRTHQIRVHLAAIGHPVVGDDRYGPGGRVGGRLLAPGRLFLHAAELAVDHPRTGERLNWRSPLPPDLQAVLEAGG